NDLSNGSDPSGTRSKDWSLRQEFFVDKAIHVLLGGGLVYANRRWFHKPKGWEVAGGALAGVLHEGPWGKKGAKGFTMGDHDLTDARGAPCSGIFDTFAFMLIPLLDILPDWPFDSSPTESMLNGGRPFWWNAPMFIPFPWFTVPSTMPS